MDPVTAIETHGLTKTFGSFTAVNKVFLKINSGELYSLIGPNGAGKTTLLNLLVGLLRPTSGTAEIFGYDVVTEPLGAKAKFGYIPDDPTVYEFLSGYEFLNLTGTLRGLDKNDVHQRIKEMTHLFPLDQKLHQPMASYSRGNKQKVAFLAALIAKPPLLIIDEPIVGLDPVSIDIFGKTIRVYAKSGGSVIFVTHTLAFAQKYATRVGIMREGKIAIEQTITAKTQLEKLYQQSTN